MLHEDVSKSGAWLFRWRGFMPLFLAVILLPSLYQFSYPCQSHALDQMYDLFCYGISLAGLTVRILAIGFVPRDTSGRNTRIQKATSLNTTGLYSLMRHPLYFGNFWMWMGVALFPRVWWVPLIMGAAFILMYKRVIVAEEEFLDGKFGEEYRNWASQTPVVWPRFKRWVRPDLPFSWKSVLRRENSTLLTVTSVFFAMETVGTWVVEGSFEFDWFWTAWFLIVLCLYFVLKRLKRMKLLNKPGR